MIDRAFQMLYKFALGPIAETTGDPNSYGFRLGRSTADAIGQCFLNLCQKRALGHHTCYVRGKKNLAHITQNHFGTFNAF